MKVEIIRWTVVTIPRSQIWESLGKNKTAHIRFLDRNCFKIEIERLLSSTVLRMEMCHLEINLK